MIIPFSPPKSIVVAQWLEEMDRIKAMKGRVADAPPVWLEEDAAEARVESPPVRNVVWRGGRT